MIEGTYRERLTSNPAHGEPQRVSSDVPDSRVRPGAVRTGYQRFLHDQRTTETSVRSSHWERKVRRKKGLGLIGPPPVSLSSVGELDGVRVGSLPPDAPPLPPVLDLRLDTVRDLPVLKGAPDAVQTEGTPLLYVMVSHVHSPDVVSPPKLP